MHNDDLLLGRRIRILGGRRVQHGRGCEPLNARQKRPAILVAFFRASWPIGRAATTMRRRLSATGNVSASAVLRSV